MIDVGTGLRWIRDGCHSLAIDFLVRSIRSSAGNSWHECGLPSGSERKSADHLESTNTSWTLIDVVAVFVVDFHYLEMLAVDWELADFVDHSRLRRRLAKLSVSYRVPRLLDASLLELHL